VRAFWASNLTNIWNRPEMLSSSHCPTLVDVNGDGVLDVVSLHQGTGLGIFNSADGSVIRQALSISGFRTHSQPTIHDIDGDGNLELMTCREWSQVRVLDLHKWVSGESVTESTDAILSIHGVPILCWEPPAVADITGDGFVEILASTESNISIFNRHYQFIGSIPLTNPGYYGMSMIVAQDIDNDGKLELVVNRRKGMYVYDTEGVAPTPRALSQFNYYSQHRGRSPFYQEYGPPAPIVKDESPVNGSVGQVLNPVLSVYVYDYQGDLMNVTFSTNASTGEWHTIKNIYNVHEGTYTASTTEMNALNTIYWWKVTVTDSTGKVTSKLYKFTTENNSIPVIISSQPTNGSGGVALFPKTKITVGSGSGNDSLNITWFNNKTGSWVNYGYNASVGNGTYSQTASWANEYSKKYWWKVTVDDGTMNVSHWYCFTTKSSSGGSGGSSTPPSEPVNMKPVADASAGEPYQGYVNAEITFDGSKSYDPDGNITKWYWEFGDNANGTGKIVRHTYIQAGNYTISLTVTDNEEATNTTTTRCVITQRVNQPPTQPTIAGPTNGTTNTTYNYRVLATDPDNDTIRYSIVWGDGTSSGESSPFLPSGTAFTFSHRWTTPGQYIIIVSVTDNQTGSYSQLTINITMEVEDQPSTPGFELIFIICAVAVSIFLWRRRRNI
jgi:PKD repeat protein